MLSINWLKKKKKFSGSIENEVLYDNDTTQSPLSSITEQTQAIITRQIERNLYAITVST